MHHLLTILLDNLSSYHDFIVKFTMMIRVNYLDTRINGDCRYYHPCVTSALK